jgi:hypothetical protein
VPGATGRSVLKTMVPWSRPKMMSFQSSPAQKTVSRFASASHFCSRTASLSGAAGAGGS